MNILFEIMYFLNNIQNTKISSVIKHWDLLF